VALPAMRGTDLAIRLAAKRADIRVLYISGYSAQQIMQEDPSTAGRAYLQKPFTGDALLQSTREVLDVPVEATILIADDDPGIRKLLEGVLHSSGYRVLEASDGRQAVEQLGNNTVDLLITDLLMPDQEGIETIRSVRKRFPGLKIIAMSGGFGEQFLNIAKLMGAHRMIRKPFETQAIREAIRHLLSHPS
jgi:CheY-like chemotaxis protein